MECHVVRNCEVYQCNSDVLCNLKSYMTTVITQIMVMLNSDSLCVCPLYLCVFWALSLFNNKVELK